MSEEEMVRVRALKNHTETHSQDGGTWDVGDYYYCPRGLARRRARAGLVEPAPLSPEPESEAPPEGGEADAGPEVTARSHSDEDWSCPGFVDG